jgi:hypothetical protein
VLARGVQRIGEVAADLIRFTDSQNDRDIATVAPDVIGAVPILDTLHVSAFRDRGGVSHDAMWLHTVAARPTGANTAVLVTQFALRRWCQPDDAGSRPTTTAPMSTPFRSRLVAVATFVRPDHRRRREQRRSLLHQRVRRSCSGFAMRTPQSISDSPATRPGGRGQCCAATARTGVEQDAASIASDGVAGPS